MRKLVRKLYQSARRLNDLSTLLSFSPKKVLRRLSNKVIGRNLLKRIFFD